MCVCEVARRRVGKAKPHLGALVAGKVVPPSNAGRSDTVETAFMQRDRHVQHVEPKGPPDLAERVRMVWQNASGCNQRVRVEAAMARWSR